MTMTMEEGRRSRRDRKEAAQRSPSQNQGRETEQKVGEEGGREEAGERTEEAEAEGSKLEKG